MTPWPNLFEQKTMSHKHDPQTSRKAAGRVIDRELRESWHTRILKALRCWDRPEGWTPRELAFRLGGAVFADKYYHDISRRMSELHSSESHPEREDLIYCVGERNDERAWRIKLGESKCANQN